MSRREPDRIGLREFARGLAGLAPEARSAFAGVRNLLRVRFGARWSIGTVIETHAEQRPDAVALRFEGARWTYREFNEWANRIASVFREDEIRPGDVVCLLMENHPAALAGVAALAKIGAIAGMLNPQLRGDALRHSVRAMQPKRLVIAAECAASFADLSGGWQGPAPYRLPGHGGQTPASWADLDARQARARGGNPGSAAEVDPAWPCYYILTSGTTGMPKASVMTHRRWLRGMAGLGQMALRLKPEDTLYCALPLYHNNALTVSWGAVLGSGAALALDRKFSATRFWDRIRHYDATAFAYIGELCRYLLAQPPSPADRDHRVRACIGNGLRPAIWEAFRERFGIAHICEFYAASEGNLGFANLFNLPRTAGFCPWAYAVVECDPDTAQPKRDARGRLIEVPRGGTGLLVTEVTDSAPFDGYTDGKATASKLIRGAFDDGDCWYNTGDLVRDQGFKHIQFVDRLGDTFRWKGENVATTEVEAVLLACPGVEDCAVYGVPVPDTEGRAGMAALRLADGTDPRAPELAARLRAVLPVYAVPPFLRVVPELSTTATFKTRKAELRAQGCDPQRVTDPLYVLFPESVAFEPLTGELWARIARGDRRL